MFILVVYSAANLFGGTYFLPPTFPAALISCHQLKVFPDNYHLSTLHEFLNACAELHQDVHIKNVLGTLIDHLASYAIAEDSPGIPEDIQLFEIFYEQVMTLSKLQQRLQVWDTMALLVSLTNLAL